MDRELATLQDHAQVLGRRWRLIAVFVVLGAAAGLGLSNVQNPVFSASATLLIEANGTPQTGGTTTTIDTQAVATQAEVLLSDSVADRVIKQLHLTATPDELVQTVSVSPSTDSNTIEISATRPSATGAADVANAFARAYIGVRNDQAARAAKQIRDSYVSDLADIKVRLGKLQKTSEKTLALGATPDPAVTAEIQSLVARQSELEAALTVAESPAGTPTVTGQLLNRAQVPATPSAPRPLRAGVLGGVLGLIFGVLIGYARDRADDTVHAGQRLDGVTGNAPVLGQIPSSPGERRGRVAGLLDPRSGISEAYRALSTNLRFLLAANVVDGLDGEALAHAGGIVVVTSASPDEGKTSAATNLAVAAARAGKRVLLVDADLRNPHVANRFGLDAPEGFSELLLGDQPPGAYVQDIGVENLQLLPAGSIPPNPAELLATPRARILWRELRQTSDLVIVDTAPILNVADTLEVVGDADEVVLVVRSGRSRLRHVAGAVQRLRQVGARPSGVVLNDLPAGEVSYGYGVSHHRAAQTQR